MKAILKNSESAGMVATTPSGKATVSVEHGVLYDYIDDTDNERFYLLINDTVFEEQRTAFDFINKI